MKTVIRVRLLCSYLHFTSIHKVSNKQRGIIAKLLYNKGNKTLNLPSKKLFMFFIPAIILLGIFSLFYKDKPSIKSDQENSAAPTVVSVRSNVISTADTDGDGVPDWQELIWSTDINKAETFGMPDKDYIAQKIASDQNRVSSSSSINSTLDLSQQLFARYVNLQSSGQLNEDTINTMTADIAASIQVSSTGTDYTAEKLTTFPDSDANKLREYGDTLVSLRNQFADAYNSQYTNTSLAPEDPSFSQNSLIIGDFYTKLSLAFMNIPVPQGAVQFHLAYANAIKDSGLGFKAMGEINKEPLNALMGLQKHLQAQEIQARAIANLKIYFQRNGIINLNITPF